MEKMPKKNLENYFVNNGYSDLEIFGEGIDKYIDSSKSFKRYSGDLKLEDSGLDYKSINNSMKSLDKKKNNIEKRISFENKKRNSSKLLRILMNFGDLFSSNSKKDIWGMAGDYSENMNNFEEEIEKPSGYLRKSYDNLNKGFSNLCYSWVKSEEVLNKLNSDKLKYEILKKDKKIFSVKPLKNYRELRKLKKDLNETNDKIKTIEERKKSIEKSFETFKVLFDKNQSDRLFLRNIKRDLNFHNQYLGFIGDSISDFDNYSGRNLNTEKVLSEYFKGKRNVNSA